MKAMILAAGRGVRMGALTERCPKPLLLVGKKPLIVWQIERLVRAGFHDIVINAAYLAADLHAALGDGTAFGARFQWSFESPGLETAGGLRRALPWLGPGPFVAVNADVFCEYALAGLRTRLASEQSAHLVMVDNPPHHPEGDFSLEAGLCHTRPHAPRFTFAGIGVYHPRLFATLPADTPAPLGPLLRAAMETAGVSGEHYAGLWRDVGTPERLSEVSALIEARIAKKAVSPE